MEDASRFHERFRDWQRYGISAFYAANDAEIDALCEDRLVRFERVIVFQRHDLELAGVEVIPTFRTPHLTLCHTVLDELIRRLVGCDHREITNPYHVREPGAPT